MKGHMISETAAKHGKRCRETTLRLHERGMGSEKRFSGRGGYDSHGGYALPIINMQGVIHEGFQTSKKSKHDENKSLAKMLRK